MPLRSYPTHRLASGWQEPSRFLHRYTEPFLSALARSKRGAWEAIDALPMPKPIRDVFERARAEDRGFVLPQDVMFPDSAFPFMMTLGGAGPGELVSFELDDAQMLAGLASALSGQWREAGFNNDGAEFAEQLVAAGVLRESPPVSVDWSRPGIYRLQHASLLFRGEAGTILTDPVFQDDWVWAGALPPVDAILISHAHGDHFSLPSLMQFPRDTTIVVPQAECGSMLGDDMATLLRLAGFTHVIAAPWYSTVRVADVAVHVYPFYGEQPWVTFESPAAGLRNNGNTYLVDVDGFRTWVLIDAGQEYEHSMADVASRVHDEHGPLDLLTSNLRVFPWHPGQIDGSGRFLFCFPAEVLSDPSTWPQGRSITLGPDGVRELLRLTQARAFVPYAHWWHRPGVGPHVVDGTVEESEMVAEIADETLSASLLTWNVGDRLESFADQIRFSTFV